MNNVQYASTTSKGNMASSIGWINFGNDFKLFPNKTSIKVENKIPGGYTIQFDLSLTATSYPALLHLPPCIASKSPVFDHAPFGNTAYTGINQFVSLCLESNPTIHHTVNYTLQINNISVYDCERSPVQAYTIFIADSEVTNKGTTGFSEAWSVTTDGSPLTMVEHMPAYSGTLTGPTVTGINTKTITETGQLTTTRNTSAYLYATESPTSLVVQTAVNGGNESCTIGIIVNEATHRLEMNFNNCFAMNKISENHPQLYRMPKLQSILGKEMKTSLQYGKTCYPIADIPIVIEGTLGTYTISTESMLFMPNQVEKDATIDIFTLTFSTECTQQSCYLFFCHETAATDACCSNH